MFFGCIRFYLICSGLRLAGIGEVLDVEAGIVDWIPLAICEATGNHAQRIAILAARGLQPEHGIAIGIVVVLAQAHLEVQVAADCRTGRADLADLLTSADTLSALHLDLG